MTDMADESKAEKALWEVFSISSGLMRSIEHLDILNGYDLAKAKIKMICEIAEEVFPENLDKDNKIQ